MLSEINYLNRSGHWTKAWVHYSKHCLRPMQVRRSIWKRLFTRPWRPRVKEETKIVPTYFFFLTPKKLADFTARHPELSMKEVPLKYPVIIAHPEARIGKDLIP